MNPRSFTLLLWPVWWLIRDNGCSRQPVFSLPIFLHGRLTMEQQSHGCTQACTRHGFESWGGADLSIIMTRKETTNSKSSISYSEGGGMSSFYLKVLFKIYFCTCSRPKKWKGPRQLLQNSIFTCIYVNLWNMSVVRKMSGGGVGWSPLDATFLRGRGCTRTYINSVRTSNWEVYFRAN